MTAAHEPRTPRGLERFTVTRWFALVVGGLVVVAALGLIAGVLALGRLGDARESLADRLDPALLAGERLETALVNEETGVRGYALSMDAAFLGPYRRGRRAEEHAYARLVALSGATGLAEVRATLERVRAAAGDWRARYAEPVLEAVGAADDPPPATEGRRLFDRVRAAADDLEAEVAARRAAARDDLERTADFVLVLFLAVGALLLASVLAAAAALRATIIAPLARLAGDVGRVAGGDFSLRVRASGPREIAELGRGVEAMRARIVAEVTALREAEAALKRRSADLERSNAELEQFAYVASHDLQEPLRKVASFTQMLQRGYAGALDERADTYIELAVDGAKRMQELINDLLAFSRVGRIEGRRDRVEAGALVARATANLATSIEDAGATVAVADLPDVDGDAGLLTLVFQNLIANAIKFHAPGRPPHVSISAERASRGWRFVVTDNGIGVEPEYAERIFEIFQRLHTRTAYEGTGIGLAMCRKIVEYHGGRIWLGPTPSDGGSTFCFTLPADHVEHSG